MGEIGSLKVNRLNLGNNKNHTFLLVVAVCNFGCNSARCYYGDIAQLNFAGGAPKQDGRSMTQFAEGLMAYHFKPKENSQVVVDLRSDKGTSVISAQIVVFEKILPTGR